jgi:CBS domain-containing protein
MSNQILVKKTNSEQEFMNFSDFTRVVVLDENESSANVYIEGKLVGTIFDSDIDRLRDAQPGIVEPGRAANARRGLPGRGSRR